MNEQEKIDRIVKHAAVQAIVELHKEIGLDKILLEAAEAYGRGERDPIKVSNTISKKFNVRPMLLCSCCEHWFETPKPHPHLVMGRYCYDCPHCGQPNLRWKAVE